MTWQDEITKAIKIEPQCDAQIMSLLLDGARIETRDGLYYLDKVGNIAQADRIGLGAREARPQSERPTFPKIDEIIWVHRSE